MRTLQIYATALLLLLAVMASVFSCEKDVFDDESGFPISTDPSPPAVVFSSSDQGPKNGEGYERTELGALRQNPYTVENLAAAMNEIYGTQLDRVPTTHRYLKFEPQDENDLRLLEAHDFDLFDFPLEREVIKMGDYYFKPENKEDLPEYWTVVPVDDELPAVPHELIAEVNLTESDPFLMRAAFTRTGNGAEIDERFPLPLGLSLENFVPAGNGSFNDCFPGCPSWPCCLADALDCEDDYIPDWCLDFDPECYPGLPNYPACLEGDEPDDGPALNDCGCILSANPRFPGGCVRVMDSELGYEGVRGVKIKAWNGWLTTHSTYTDDNGCWRIDHSYSGNARFWVKFKDANGTRIRGAREGAAFWQHLSTISDYVGVVAGPVFNNITINYDMWTEEQSTAHRYWSAATVNNRIHDYNDNAQDYQIASLPELDVYVALNRRGGFALMTSHLEFGALINIVASGLSNSTHFGEYPFFNTLAGSTFGITAESLRRFIPDVVIGTNDPHSDHLAEVAFHELGHAGIFDRLNSDYWEDLCIAEIMAEDAVGHPWGNAESYRAGHIAVMESWSEHIANRFTHDRYGSNNNIGEYSYLVRLEATRNFLEGHIPIGIYQDLADNNDYEPFSYDVEGPWAGLVNDEVAGISMSRIFQVIDSDVISTNDLQQRILTEIVPSVNATADQVNLLFDSYE